MVTRSKHADVALPSVDSLPDRRQKVQSAEVAMQVLKKLALLGGSASLTALSQALGESPAKIHRYLVSLVNSELVFQHPLTGHYVLGWAAIMVGLSAMRQAEPITCSAQALASLAATHNLSCCLALSGNRGPTIVRWEDPWQPVTVNIRVGSVMPVLWSATGRIFAAFANSALIEAAIKQELRDATPAQRRLLPDRKHVDSLLQDIRTWGCSPIRDLMLAGISSIAVPVFDASGQLAASIAVLGVSSSFDENPKGKLAMIVKDCAAGVSKRMGYEPAV